jgi:hypothetical protein
MGLASIEGYVPTIPVPGSSVLVYLCWENRSPSGEVNFREMWT